MNRKFIIFISVGILIFIIALSSYLFWVSKKSRTINENPADSAGVASPASIKTDNAGTVVLEPVPYKVGDKLGEFIVNKIEPFFKDKPIPVSADNFIVFLSGETKISGRFEEGKYCIDKSGNRLKSCVNLEKTSEIGYDIYFFPDEESLNKIPLRGTITLGGPKEFLKKFDDVGHGTATITIKDFIFHKCSCVEPVINTTITSIIRIKH